MACGTPDQRPVGSIFPYVCVVTSWFWGRSFDFPVGSESGCFPLFPLGIWFLCSLATGRTAVYGPDAGGKHQTLCRQNVATRHHNPLWYNFLTIIWGWIPWTLVLLISLFGLKWNEMHLLPTWKLFHRTHPGRFGITSAHNPHTAVYLDSDYRYFCLLLYSKSKRSVYLLPIYHLWLLNCPVSGGVNAKGAKEVFKISVYILPRSVCYSPWVFCCTLSDDTGQHMGQRTSCWKNIAFMQALESTSFSISKWLIIVLPVVAAICTLRLVIKKSSMGHSLWNQMVVFFACLSL